MRKAVHPIAELIIKYLEGRIGHLEKQELDRWVNESKENRELFNEMRDEYRMSKDLTEHSEDKRATWEKIIAMAPELEEAPVRRINWRRYVAAAAVLIMTGLGVWYIAVNNTNKASVAQTNKSRYGGDVEAPAGNKAVLVLADGKTINLDEVNNGQLAEQGIMQVVKQADGTIEYRKSEVGSLKSEVAYNTISTNKGGRYKIVLADNSVVWLNSVSSLKYPTAFTGDERVVELTGGEAYFEIAKSTLPGKAGIAPKRRPFIVKLNGMEVEVLGTHFNIMSYADESSIKATLLEGSVRVTPVPVSGGAPMARHSQLLSPGQQAVLAEKAVANGKSNPLQVMEADTEEAVAWKNSVFIYNNAPIETIMREVARSYDVDVEYEGGRTTEKFTLMGVPRNVPVSKVLDILALTEKVKFEIEGRKITVKKV